MLGIEAYIQYLNQTDKTVLKALEVLEKGESFPKAPEETVEIKVNDEGNKKETAQADSTGRRYCFITHWVMKYRRMIL